MTLPAPPPDINPETSHFWSATTQGKLLLPHCPNCSDVFWYPRAVCPGCLHTPIDWIEASGLGTIYSFTVLRRPVGAYSDIDALVIAYVQLDEGPRILTNISGEGLTGLAIGKRVRLVWSPASSDAALYRFELSP